MRFLLKALAAASLCWSSVVMAAPVSFSFSGVVTRFFNFDTHTEEVARYGTTFTGTYTIDLSSAEDQKWSLSQSGCGFYLFGACQQNFGGGASVFTDWTLTLGSQTWSSPATNVSNQALTTQSVSSSTVKQVYWGEYQTVVSPSSPRPTATYSTVSLNLLTGNNSPSADYPDHLEAPDVSENDFAEFRFIANAYTCSYVVGQGCWNTPVYSGLMFDGIITSWEVAGANTVPEPSSILLLGVGLAAMIRIRRRR